MLTAGAEPPSWYNRDMPDFTRIAESTAKRRAILDHTETDTGTEIDHRKV